MKKTKISVILLLLVSLVSLVALASCGGDPTPQIPAETEYVINCRDYNGNVPEMSLFVEIYKGEELIGMNRVGADGAAKVTLSTDSYTFRVCGVDTEFYYDFDECHLSYEKPEATAILYSLSESEQTISYYDEAAMEHKDFDAARVAAGATYVEITRPERTYVIFTPTEGGVYKFSCIGSDAVIGYFGSPHFVQSTSVAELKDGAFEIPIQNSSISNDEMVGTSQFVIGITSEEQGVILLIERLGDVPADEYSDNWVVERADSSLTGYDSLLNDLITDIDITDSSVKVVYNESDGYYHYGSENGPLVVFKVSAASAYLPAFTVMCETTRLCRYFYDDNGNYIKKISYNDLIYDYAALAGNNGTVPLDKPLAEMIKNIGEYNHWWDFSELESPRHIFGDTFYNVVADNAWLFACAYVTEGACGTETAPAGLALSTAQAPVTEKLRLSENAETFVKLGGSGYLYISNAQGVRFSVGGETYTADENGKISGIKLDKNSVLVFGTCDSVISIELLDTAK